MKTIIYTEIDKNFINEWLSLWKNCEYATYANSPYWFLSVTKTFSPKKYKIIAVYNNNDLVAAAPLIKKRKYGLEFYTFTPEDYICALPFLADLKNQKILKILVTEFLKLGNIFLPNASQELANSLKLQTPKISLLQDTLNFYLHINKDEKGQAVIRNKKKLMRRAQKIEKELKLKSYDYSPKDIWPIIFNIDNKSRKKSMGYSVFSSKWIKTFHVCLAENFKEKFLINILYHEKKPVAYELGFLINGSFYCSQIASIKEYDIYSISRVLLIKLIESLSRKGTGKIDFGSGDDHVKRSFTQNYDPLSIIIISKNTPIRLYLHTILKLRKSIFRYLQQHKTLYTSYRQLKNILGIVHK